MSHALFLPMPIHVYIPKVKQLVTADWFDLDLSWLDYNKQNASHANEPVCKYKINIRLVMIPKKIETPANVVEI